MKGEYFTLYLIAVESWPEGARAGFEKAKWFVGDFDKHFLGFFNHISDCTAWLMYDDGRVIPLGRALLFEDDMDKLNLEGILKSKDSDTKDVDIDLTPLHNFRIIVTRNYEARQ